MLTRRTLLQGAALAATATLGPVRRARAEPTGAPKNLIVLLVAGGWDTTYSIDPKAAPDVDVPAGAVRMHGALDIFEDVTRPAIGAFFDRYASITAVVRGIHLASVSHEACTQSILTGARNETSPDVAAIVAHAHAPGLPIPYLVLGNHAFAGPYAASMGRVGATNQLVALLDPAQAYPVAGQRARPFVPTSTEDAYVEAYMQARATRDRAVRGATGYNKRQIDDFTSSWMRGNGLRSLGGQLGTRGTLLDLAGQRTLALDALANGVSKTVMLASGLNWDTHEDNASQGGSQNALFGNLMTLVDDLAARSGANAGSTMLDETVIAVVSEMGRTPKLNSSALPGKDHWPVTSAMVIGSNVRGDRAWGATSATGEARAIDFATGDPSDSGLTLEPKHVLAGVLGACGVDASTYLPEAMPFDAYLA